MLSHFWKNSAVSKKKVHKFDKSEKKIERKTSENRMKTAKKYVNITIGDNVKSWVKSMKNEYSRKSRVPPKI